MTAVLVTAAVAGAVITLVVVIAGLLEPHGAHHGGRAPAPLQPRRAVRVIYDARCDPYYRAPRRPLSPFPVAGQLELQPVPPAATTGELPMLTQELGKPVDAYLSDLFDAPAGVLP